MDINLSIEQHSVVTQK